MSKKHLKIDGVDARAQGQTDFEYEHQTACGYVRENITRDGDGVECKLCLNSIHMVNYHAINKTLTDSQGCY